MDSYAFGMQSELRHSILSLTGMRDPTATLTRAQEAQIRHFVITCQMYNRELKRIMTGWARSDGDTPRNAYYAAELYPVLLIRLNVLYNLLYIKQIPPRPGGQRYGIYTASWKRALRSNVRARNKNYAIRDQLGIPRNFEDWDQLESYNNERLEFLWRDYIYDNELLNAGFKIIINMWKNSNMQFENIPDFILNNSDEDAYTYLMNHLTPDLLDELFSLRTELVEFNEALLKYKHYLTRMEYMNEIMNNMPRTRNR
jgi:hypothetical protein